MLELLFNKIKDFISEKMEQIGGAFVGLLYYFHIPVSTFEIWVLKFISTIVLTLVSGFFYNIGKKAAQKWFKVLVLFFFAQFISGCSLSYRINKNCRVYSECTLEDGKCRACVECTDKSIIDKITPKKQ
jgi:hypothetical protein